jgi:hypothetical protein
MQAFADNKHALPKRNRPDCRIIQGSRPGFKPGPGRNGVMDGVVKRGHEMRLTKTPLADDDNGPALIRSDCLNALQEIVGWVGDLKELGGSNLGRARVAIVRELDGRALEPLALEFLT